jgi:hypothetical protein
MRQPHHEQLAVGGLVNLDRDALVQGLTLIRVTAQLKQLQDTLMSQLWSYGVQSSSS